MKIMEVNADDRVRSREQSPNASWRPSKGVGAYCCGETRLTKAFFGRRGARGKQGRLLVKIIVLP
jgi:hypothetical protein